MFRRMIAAVSCIFIAGLLPAEALWGPVTERHTVPLESGSEVAFVLTMGEIGIASFDATPRFVDALEFEITIPDSIRTLLLPISLAVFSNVTISDDDPPMARDARSAASHVAQNARRVVFSLPLRLDHSVRATADTIVAEPMMEYDGSPFAVTIIPVSKGMPDSARDAEFPVRIRPIFRNEGAVVLELLSPEGTTLERESLGQHTVTIDGREVVFDPDGIVLVPGVKRLGLQSETYREYSASIGVERGVTKKHVVQLEHPHAKVLISAPRGTTLFVNGEIVDATSREIMLRPGEHTVMFRVGDFSVTRRIRVEPNRTYNVSLTLDVLVNED